MDSVKKAYRLIQRVKNKAEKTLSAERKYLFNLDAPKKVNHADRKIEVEGWIISKKRKPVHLRIRNNNKTIHVDTGLYRYDVGKTHSADYGELATYSGFAAQLEFEDGDLVIEVKDGAGYRVLVRRKLKYGVDHTPDFFYNKDLAWRQAEHDNLIESRRQYFYEPEYSDSLTLSKKDPRLMAIYLPQYHPFPENDRAWGKGFTEWTNVTTGSPRFIGHQQPVLPSDLGFYDLRLEGKIKEQIDLAKKHGIYGFAFYYYWFSGKKLMDGPIEAFMRHKEWDFNFSICWANENWTKRWDGRSNDIIIAQEYKHEDPLEFIKDVENILNDPRYLTYDGKPILTVYRPSDLKDPVRYAKVWREYFKKKFKKELYLVTVFSFDDIDPRTIGFDAAQDFAPLSAFFKNKLFDAGEFPYIHVDEKKLDINFEGTVADYRSIALNNRLIDAYPFKTFPCIAPSWDNDARKKGKGFVYLNSSPDIYAKWLDNTLDIYTKKEESPIIYINAWNEWAEGAMIEPSQHLGHATLNQTSRVLRKYTEDSTKKAKRTPRLAVVVHLYYPDTWPQIQVALNKIGLPFDIHISLMDRDRDIVLDLPKGARGMYRYIVPNRGRDVLPFIYILNKIQDDYKYILKLHSKGTRHYTDGSRWLDQLLSGLLPSRKAVDSVIRTLQNSETGVVAPSEHIVSLKRHMGSNEPLVNDLATRCFGELVAKEILKKREFYPFPAGTMFWARMDTLRPLADLYLLPDDFQSEHKQLDGTLAHAVERFIGILAQSNGKKMYEIKMNEVHDVSGASYTQKYTNAP